ncbi:MAG: L-threonylcarbamoyladenylate synthase [Treponema sp.]|nr:L-threonylcarbamoyladenylate synthase [Treponema sp.]
MTIEKNSPFSAKETADCLASGKIAIVPTDTVYGFSGIVDLKADGKKNCDCLIRKIKGRGEDKPFIQLIASPEEIWNYTDDRISEELLALWPGPLTIIVHVKEDSPQDTELTAIAFRCPGDKWLRDVIRRTGRPIYSSSVNRSGSPVLSTIADIEKEFAAEVSLIVRDGDKRGSLPSTIVSVEDGIVKVIRQGAMQLPAGLTASTAACP